MVRVGHVGENARMNMRIERLDSPVKAFRESCDIADFDDLYSKLGKPLRGRTGGNHFCSRRDEGFRQHVDAVFVEY